MWRYQRCHVVSSHMPSTNPHIVQHAHASVEALMYLPHKSSASEARVRSTVKHQSTSFMLVALDSRIFIYFGRRQWQHHWHSVDVCLEVCVVLCAVHTVVGGFAIIVSAVFIIVKQLQEVVFLRLLMKWIKRCCSFENVNKWNAPEPRYGTSLPKYSVSNEFLLSINLFVNS